MMEIKYEETIKGGSDGWSYVLGEKDGKLYMVGFQALDGSQLRLSVSVEGIRIDEEKVTTKELVARLQACSEDTEIS